MGIFRKRTRRRPDDAATTKGFAQPLHDSAPALVEKDPQEMSTAELRTALRTRVISLKAFGEAAFALSYARPFVDDLKVVLCVDFPENVRFLTDADVGELPLSLDELYSLGQINTNREPSVVSFALENGIVMRGGTSLFTASKAADLPASIEGTSIATVFAIPSHEMLITVPITGPDSEDAVIEMGHVAIGAARRGSGRFLSSDLYLSHDSVITRLCAIDHEGLLTLEDNPRLQQAFADAAASTPPRS